MTKEKQYSTCLHANGQFCKPDVPFQALTNPLTCIMVLYTRNDQEIEAQCSLSILQTPPTFLPIVIMSNLWIFISTHTMQGSAIIMIYPDKVTSSSLLLQPFLMLRSPQPAVLYHDISAYPPHYEEYTMTIHVSLNKVNLHAINISVLDFTFGNTSVTTGSQFTHGN